MKLAIIADDDSLIGSSDFGYIDVLISLGDLYDGAIQRALDHFRPRKAFAVRGNHDSNGPRKQPAIRRDRWSPKRSTHRKPRDPRRKDEHDREKNSDFGLHGDLAEACPRHLKCHAHRTSDLDNFCVHRPQYQC